MGRVMERHGLSQRHACRLVGLDRSTLRYQRKRPDDATVRQRLRDLAAQRRRFGYRRLGWMLAREGHTMNHKKLYRLYHEERLMVRRRRGRKRALGTRAPMTLPNAINQRWSLDFVSDTLSDGRRFRILCIVDDFSRECLATVVDTSLGGTRGARTRAAEARAQHSQGDRQRQWHGTNQLRGLALGHWSSRLALHRAGQARAERLHRELQQKLRDECLNEHVFLTLAEARETIEAWRHDYNDLRPHGSLGALTPTEFAALKRQETQPPEEGQTTGGLYL